MAEMNSTPPVAAKKAPQKVSLSVKFIGRYVPPPKPKAQRRRKSTLKSKHSSLHILEEDEELMDEILDDEEEQLIDADKFGSGNISEIMAENNVSEVLQHQ